MATKRISLFGALTPGTANTPPWFEPTSLTQTNDRYAGQLGLRYKDTATKDTAAFRFPVPDDYNAGGTFEVIWTSTGTSGNVVWKVDYSSASKTSSLDPSADEENLSVTTAAPGASQTGVASSLAATAANLSANDICQGNLSRDGSSGSDTLAADAVVYDFIFQYTT